MRTQAKRLRWPGALRLAATAALVSALLLLLLPGALAVSGTDMITTVAGGGKAGPFAGFSGDGGQATSAELSSPRGVAVDSAGNIYIADERNNRVRKVSPAGIITTIAGTGTRGETGDGGPATQAQLDRPLGVAVDSAGNVYIADVDNAKVRKVSPAGIITTIAGTGTAQGADTDNGPATEAEIGGPLGVAVDSAGNVYIADDGWHKVRKVSPDGIITTIAGTGTRGDTGDGGPATEAELNTPRGMAVDSAGNVYIADHANMKVRKVSPAGIITTIAGTGTQGDMGDGGPATSAELSAPSGVAVDSAGNIYIADSFNSKVRKVSPAGIITTIGGTGTRGDNGDGGPASSAQLHTPFGVALDAAGNLYIADSWNNNVRKITNGATAPRGAPTPTARCKRQPATIVGTPGPDVLTGTPGPDVIAALGGNDIVRALGGDDLICLGAGNDRGIGGGGADSIYGQAGNDRLFGAGGNDVLRGGGASDLLRGGPGADRLFGQGGPDRLFGQGGRDRLAGGAGSDLGDGGPGRDPLCQTERKVRCP